MRRYVTFALLGLGVFAVVAGLMLSVYAYPKLAKAPHDIDTISVAKGDRITALVYVPQGDRAVPEIRRDLSLTSTRKVTGDLKAEEVARDGDVTVWVEATKLVSDRDGLTVTAGVRSLCLDRHSGEMVTPCENQYYEKETGKRVKADRGEAQQPGLSFKFPFGTEKKTYRWYDGTVRQARDARYVGEDTVKDLPVYKFVQEIPSTKVDEREVPGSLVGQPGVPTVKAALHYEVVRTFWVEPVTGKVVDGSEQVKQELRPATGPATTVFEGTLKMTDETVTANVGESEENLGKLFVITTLPTVLYVVGGVLIAVSLLLLATDRPGRHLRNGGGAATRVQQPVGV
ncbi:DUF3068 domain-containing protein [Saccharothrix variisporea]|uniref:DUF3068 family protein n=1 Tax=Saccharothrix variisporea TaxID=543527 RepID=A0A495XJS9_9PSEU|nr:DUF3068 domain-containing protein [Saccharothrix variisporea]RKT72673.1 DUF3068 family protein [Saccharothrix variisporea]